MVSNSLSQEKKEIIDVDEFLDKYEYISNLDLKHILNLDFELDFYYKSKKQCPIIELAKPEDAKEVADVFNEIYRGTYPYKQMEDLQAIRDMIIHPDYHWFLFKLPSQEIVGCFGADLDFNKKRALLHGFNIRKQYQKTIDIFKAFIGCIIYLWREYREKIFFWYGEMRTNEAISQFFTSLIGMKPIAFLPNKDIFYNKVESDILHIIYNKSVLTSYRSEETPKIIRPVLNCYSYANKRYQLGLPIVENPKVTMDLKAIKNLIVSKTIKEDKFGYQKIKFSIKNSNSYFKFFLNPFSKNIEKVDYCISKLEELYVFIENLLELVKERNIDYVECYVSAYEPLEQKIFHNAGFEPRGYICCWNYDKEIGIFRDQILFNLYKGKIDENTKLIPESIELLTILNFFDKEFTIKPFKFIK
ncbi:MAG: hypothetical protein ACFE8V_14470 [Promethearchaeota archaeon]